MQIWTNTKTLDGYLPNISFVKDPSTAEVALVGGKAIQLADFPNLLGIFKTGIGRDNVPEQEARGRGIVCAYPSAETCRIIYEETASFACHLVLKCLLAEVGEFASWKKLDRPALATREVLVLGTGNIGTRVADKLRAFLRVETFDVLNNRPEELAKLIRAADCVSLHIPLTAETRGFFDAEKLAWMKDGASLVNTARGPVVEENALYAELAKGRLRAAFDVFWEEPYQGKLMQLPPERFMVTPHVASTCREFISSTATDFINFLKQLKKV